MNTQVWGEGGEELDAAIGSPLRHTQHHADIEIGVGVNGREECISVGCV